MKKLLALMASLALVLTLSACGDTTTTDEPVEVTGYEIAEVTDLGTIDDKSFNQGAWEGLEAYAMDNDLTYKYYQPTDGSTEGRITTCELAIENGAKVLVLPGYLFETVVFDMQDRYPDVKFIILDGEPNNGDYSAFEAKTGDNVAAIKYAEHEAGYLAGYAAVKEGYTKLGFMGGMAVPAVVKFGQGYVQGAEQAAIDMGITDEVSVQYNYTGVFNASPEIQTLASAWYSTGTEVIFSCGGGIYSSVQNAAEVSDGGMMIGVDSDQNGYGDVFLTSSMKMLQASVYDTLDAFYNGTFPGGMLTIYDLAMDGVGLPMETSRFETFTEADYTELCDKIKDGTYTVDYDGNNTDPTSFVSEITVNFIS